MGEGDVVFMLEVIESAPGFDEECFIGEKPWRDDTDAAVIWEEEFIFQE